MSLTVVLITGANSGVGYAAARVIASAGENFHVIMTGRSLEKVQGAKSEIEATGDLRGQLSALRLDVTDDSTIQAAVAHVDRQFGKLDVLVNNAGYGGTEDPNLRTRMQGCMEVNVIGPAVVAAAFRPLLLKSTNPYSIYMGSGAGTTLTGASNPPSRSFPTPKNPGAYGVSKAALNMLMVQEHMGFKDSGLKVIAMNPGFVVSNLRGTSEELRGGWGYAGDPMESGKLCLSIIQGQRDADLGKLVHVDGVYPW